MSAMLGMHPVSDVPFEQCGQWHRGDGGFTGIVSLHSGMPKFPGGGCTAGGLVGGVGVADAPLPRDVFRLLRAESTAHHCTLRMRTSAEFEVAGTYGATVRPGTQVWRPGVAPRRECSPRVATFMRY